MEFASKPSRSAARHRRTGRYTDYDLFSRFITAQADQAITPDSPGGAVNPTALQEGQSVFSNEGEEMVIVGDPEDTTDKVLMPADVVQMGQPGGAVSVEDAELASTYSLQSPLGVSASKGPVVTMDGSQYFPGENYYVDSKGCNRHLGYSTREFNENSRCADLIMDLDMPARGGVPDLATAVKNDSEEDGLRLGKPGYMEIVDSIKAMKDIGYQTVDIVMNIGELYDRDLGERVLAEARRKGII